jgi:hypothetical protein
MAEANHIVDVGEFVHCERVAALSPRFPVDFPASDHR